MQAAKGMRSPADMANDQMESTGGLSGSTEDPQLRDMMEQNLLDKKNLNGELSPGTPAARVNDNVIPGRSLTPEEEQAYREKREAARSEIEAGFAATHNSGPGSRSVSASRVIPPEFEYDMEIVSDVAASLVPQLAESGKTASQTATIAVNYGKQLDYELSLLAGDNKEEAPEDVPEPAKKAAAKKKKEPAKKKPTEPVKNGEIDGKFYLEGEEVDEMDYLEATAGD